MYLPLIVRRTFALVVLAAGLVACGPQSSTVQPTAPVVPVQPTAEPVQPTAEPVPPTAEPAVPLAVAEVTVQRFLESYFAGGDAHVYLGGPLAAEVAAGRPLHQLVGSQPGYRGFTVHEAEGLADGGAGLWADITYGDTVLEHRFELAPSLGEWVIVGISVGNSRPAEVAPGAGGEWRSGYSGDLTGDGVPEQISYKEVTIQLPPVGFSDPSIVSLHLASELAVRMEGAPNGRELLYLSPAGLTAEGLLLASFGDAQPAGFIVVVYGGQGGLSISPLRADGQPHGGPALEVVWNEQENGYRLR